LTITEALLRPLWTKSPSRPLITHYDDAAGTRVELSVATLANWAAKTANWLTEDLDLEPGDPVSVALPTHWQTAAIILGSWWCGAHLIDDPTKSAVAFLPPTAEIPAADNVAVVSLDPMGRPLDAPPAATLDYITESRLHGDDFLALVPIPGSTPALLDLTVDEVLTAARATTLAETDRVLSTMDWTLPDGVIKGLLSVLAAGASLVQVTNPTHLDAHRTSERTTTDLP
jgi:uncharacterized protein (TIGR03089 family)